MVISLFFLKIIKPSVLSCTIEFSFLSIFANFFQNNCFEAKSLMIYLISRMRSNENNKKNKISVCNIIKNEKNIFINIHKIYFGRISNLSTRNKSCKT